MRRCFDMQIRTAFPNRRGVGIGIDLVSTLSQSIEQRKADQAIPVRFVIGQALGGAVDEDCKWLWHKSIMERETVQPSLLIH